MIKYASLLAQRTSSFVVMVTNVQAVHASVSMAKGVILRSMEKHISADSYEQHAATSNKDNET